jgi:hypothetical protein
LLPSLFRLEYFRINCVRVTPKRHASSHGRKGKEALQAATERNLMLGNAVCSLHPEC